MGGEVEWRSLLGSVGGEIEVGGGVRLQLCYYGGSIVSVYYCCIAKAALLY